MRDFLKTFIFVELGAGTVRIFAEYFEYQKYGHLTAVPLHLRIMISAGLTALIIAVTFIVWLVLGYIIKKQNRNSDNGTCDKTDVIQNKAQPMQKPKYKHKLWYWIAALMWLGIAAGWAKIALNMQRVHWPFLSWLFVLCYIGLAAWEIYRYFKDKRLQ